MASPDVTVTKSVITNKTPDPPPPDTGCRLQSVRRIVASRPLVIRRGQRMMHQMMVRYFTKQVTQEKNMIFETALTSSLVEANWSQYGLSVCVLACSIHKQQLCLQVRYNGKLLTDIPFNRNQVGTSGALHLAFMMEDDKSHVIDVIDVKVVTTVSDVVFDRPLWVMMYVDLPTYSHMKGELVSGKIVTVTQKIKQLLSSLQE